MKQLYLIIAILLVSGVSRAQTICDSCCAESFPYDFCGLTSGKEFVECSSNPNAAPNGVPVKSFIPTCVQVDTMPDNGIWQPIGPPPAPEALLSNSTLGNDTNKEAGAATQFDNDQTLYSQLPPQAPMPPVEPDEPEDTCGDDPYTGPFDAPDREAIWERYFTYGLAPYDSPFIVPPWHRPFGDNQSNWNYDETMYEAACDQFALDSANFLNDDPPDIIDTTGFDYNANAAVTWYYGVDYAWLNGTYTSDSDTVARQETDHDNWVACQSNYSTDSAAYPAKYAQYEGAALQYTADSIAWIANVNSYVQVFNQDTAQSDAQKALNGWLNLCTPPIHSCDSSHPCCLHVVMDDNIRDFAGITSGVTKLVAQTLTPGSINIVPCKDSLCPKAIIEVNVTDQFLTLNRQGNPDSGAATTQYTLHQVSRTEFFTGQTPPDTVAPGYVAYSFFELMEHEIGHYLGLNHPDDTADGGHMCRNCYTANPYWNSVTGVFDTNGVRAVMAQNNNNPFPGYNAPLQLSSEDDCQFQKLYCNACGGGSGVAPCAYVDGVATPQQDEIKAEIYPNPTTGECQLQYEVPGQEFVQVAIYDQLGILVRMVSSEYEETGERTISLGTESLTSGNYVCRVRVGENVSYINLVVKK